MLCPSRQGEKIKYKIGSAYSTQDSEEKGIQDFGGKAWGKGGLGSPKPRHDESNKMDLK